MKLNSKTHRLLHPGECVDSDDWCNSKSNFTSKQRDNIPFLPNDGGWLRVGYSDVVEADGLLYYATPLLPVEKYNKPAKDLPVGTQPA